MDPNPDPGGPKNVDPDPEHWNPTWEAVVRERE